MNSGLHESFTALINCNKLEEKLINLLNLPAHKVIANMFFNRFLQTKNLIKIGLLELVQINSISLSFESFDALCT